jgi:lipoprotein-releasing system ATP-binding protein
MNDFLKAQELSKIYSLGATPLAVLSGLTVDFAADEFSTIQGVSGSGKSTLLQVLGGLEAPDGGEVWWKGEPIYRWPQRRLAEWRRDKVGFVFQSYQLLPELSALENVELPAMIARRGDRKVSERLLAEVGLAARMEHRPAELSGGEQQRVAIARALRNEPELLLADEPTGNLDENTGVEIVNLLLALQAEKKKSLILVTHDAVLAERGRQRFRLEHGVLKRL